MLNYIVLYLLYNDPDYFQLQMQVYRNPQMKNTTNLLILNLAVADLLFLQVRVPNTATDYILMYWPFGLTWCRTVQYIIYVTAYVSIYTLVLMAADRYEGLL